MKRVLQLAVFAALAASLSALPADHRALTKSTSYGEMKQFLESVDGKGDVRVSVAATTTQGRSLFLVRIGRDETPTWKVLFYAQQHGDEISGKDALLYLIRDLADDPAKLPAGVELWIFPMMNPDGAEAGTRVSGAGVDLNRDHMTLDQPETVALHQLVQRVRPDIGVDCHEFGRQSESWKRRGWEKWPDITMDRLNNPLFDRARMAAGDRYVNAVAAAEEAAGHPFFRYWVGGAPPDEEQRHSAPDIDSAMNALGTYGGLSFILEAAARTGDEAIARELGNRVDAYLVALKTILAGDALRDSDRLAIRTARERPLPPFLPVNYLWVNPDGDVTRFPARDLATGRKVEVPTANRMTTVAVKKSVAKPLGYAIEPRAASVLAPLLQRQAVPFETLTTARTETVELCTLVRVEDDFDEVYSRYEGRQIVRRGEPLKRELPAGTLWVPLRGDSAVRASLLLEPAALYGLYQYPRYRALAGVNDELPVLRVVE